VATEAAARWEALTREAQTRILAGICLHRRQDIMTQYAGVLTLGVGYKTTGDRVMPQLCLAFMVERKGETDRPVPPTMSRRATVGGSDERKGRTRDGRL